MSAHADAAHGPITAAQKQNGLLLLILAFCWGVLATGMIVGGTLVRKMPFDDVLLVTFVGNSVTLVIGALAGEIGFRTGLNSGLIFRIVYGRRGALLPVLLLAVLLTGWHAIVVGAFGFAWAQRDGGTVFTVAAAAGGILITVTAAYGIKALERLAVPKALLLLGTALYAGWAQVEQVGGLAALRARTAAQATAPVDHLDGINLAVGSWIVGAIVMAEYTRFARSRGVALGIPFAALMIAQWSMQIVGAIGVATGGTYEFTGFLMGQGAMLGALGLATMSLSLWVSGGANMYLPGVQVAAATNRSRHAIALLLGVGGTVLAFGLYRHFEGFIGLLARLAPPIIGPVLYRYYVVARGQPDRFTGADEETTSWPAILAFAIGAAATFVTPPAVLPALFGLVVSALAYGLMVRIGSCRRPAAEPAR